MNEEPITIDWDSIDTVLLDMDGTLLDLHFDTYFWREHVPQRYAQSRGLDILTAKRVLTPRFRQSEGTLDWYCVDYWTRVLNLDIALLKEELSELITIKPYATDFLNTLRQLGKRIVLVTNAHRKSLALKLRQTRLDTYLDKLICAHDLGHPKEDAAFWGHLRQTETFDPARTLLIDDNLVALRSARRFGIQFLLAIQQPSSQMAAMNTAEFTGIYDFRQIMPADINARLTSDPNV